MTPAARRAPQEARLFAAAVVPRLRRAVHELSWLLGRGYSAPAALVLVGDHHQLLLLQRTAVARCACSDAALAQRLEHRVAAAALAGRTLRLDAYNVLTTVQVAMSGGVVLRGRDGCDRDLASLHGSARHLQAAHAALEHVGLALEELRVARAVWFLDRPIPHSARLARILLEAASERSWRWEAHVVQNPDAVLVRGGGIVATSDSAILDGCDAWFGLARHVVETRLPGAWRVDLGADPQLPDARPAARRSPHA